MTHNGLILPDHITVAEALREVGSDLPRRILPNSLTRAEMAIYDKWRDSKFFLVRNRGSETGERYRCSRHEYRPGIDQPVYHEYFTSMCVDRPWRGLEGALYAYATITHNEQLAHRLKYLAPQANIVHPRTFQPPDAFTDADIIAITIGTLEPITRARAERLAQDINAKRPPEPFVL